jgi:PKD repeat protein
MKTGLFILSFLTISISGLFAQTKSDQELINELFKDTKEIYFEFDFTSKSQMSELTKIISIDHGSTNLKVKAYANKKGFTKFLQYNIDYTLLLRPNQTSAEVKMLKGDESIRAAVGAYPTYPAYIAMMQQFAVDYPSLCTYYDLGTLPSGRKIVALKISDNPGANENEPSFLYTSSMHGDEIAGYPMMLSLIDYLLSNYGSNTRVTNMVNSIEIWINPLANPDGTYASGDLTVSGATRFNINGIDLNRNYPDPQDGLHPDGEVYQPETEIFMGFADTMDFVMAANFHGGAEVTNYPWDTWNINHADQNWWIDQCTRYTDTCQLNGSPGYMDDLFSGSIPGVTNGFDWYEVDGGRQDYTQWWNQCRELTVELSAIKIIPDAELINHYNYNVRSLLNFMESSLYGIRGVITDNCTGLPVKAKVFISGHDFDSSFVYSSADVGNYHRPIAAGTYNITYSAPGYASQTISGVNVAGYNSIATVNVVMVQLAPTTNFVSTSPAGCTGTIDFTDVTGGGVSSWTWDFGDGFTSTVQNPSHTYASSGTYTVTLTTTNCAGTDAEIKINYVTVTVAPAPLTVNDTNFSCLPVTLNLTASGAGTLKWYDAAVAGTLVNIGTTYTTPTLSTTTAYYVESENLGSTANVGKTTNAGGGSYYTGGTYHYLIFTASQPFNLLTVKVYANSSGPRTIQLRNSSGTVLQSVTTPSLIVGLNTVTLNFNVPVGTDLQLGTAGGASCNLYRNNASAVYPYDIAGTVSITDNSAGLSGYYYYFYDWQIQTTCNSARKPVYAVFNSAIGAALVVANASDNSVCDGTTVTFTAAPTNGGSTPVYQWQLNGSNVGINSPTYTNSTLNNGDVVRCIMTSSDVCVSPSTDTSVNVTMTVFALPAVPTISLSGSVFTSSASTGNQWYLNGSPIGGATGVNYTAISNGTYYSLVTDGNGCTSDTSNQLNLTNAGINDINELGFNLFPNPAETNFTVETNFIGNYTLTVIDNLGQKVLVESCSTQRITINITNLKHGMYFIQLKSKDGSLTKKLMIK